MQLLVLISSLILIVIPAILSIIICIIWPFIPPKKEIKVLNELKFYKKASNRYRAVFYDLYTKEYVELKVSVDMYYKLNKNKIYKVNCRWHYESNKKKED